MKSTAAAVSLFLALQGCAALNREHAPAPREKPAGCAGLLGLLDEAVAEAGVGDAAGARVPGFPYLRANRFVAGLKSETGSAAERGAWVAWMRRLDQQARGREIRNLPQAALERLAARLGMGPDRDELAARAHACASEVAELDLRDPESFRRLASRVCVADEYSTAMQVAGLYPVAALPVLALTARAQERFRSWHRLPLARLAWRGKPAVYLPPPAAAYSEAAVRAILGRAAQNPLGVPLPTAAEEKELLAMFAPAVLQDEAGGDDRLGAVVWGRGRPEIEPGTPTVYTYISHGRAGGAAVLQLNYVLWYPARSGPDSPWIEHGPIDGLTLRISLAPDGTPFMLDAMNTCGCYHFFVPRREALLRVRSLTGELAPFVPRHLPEGFPESRLLVRVTSGWHQIDHIGTVGAAATPDPVAYRLRPYEELESMPAGPGANASLFDPAGIAKGSGRIEPYILFSMGVPSVGSMRQRGHHAILFIGRGHFDDPGLFDRNFEFR
jgi:hypothetical protein